MPAHEKTTRDAIVSAGRELVERVGADGLTMQAVATLVGVRAPSLYKRVRDRRELVDLVVDAILDDLGTQLSKADDEPDPRRRVVLQANALRAFAHGQPLGFALMFTGHGAAGTADRPGPAVAPVLAAVTEIVGPEHALDGARLITAWANGFITMELGDALRMGGDIDAAWDWGLSRIVAALG